MSGWQDIASAPRDGRREFLLHDANYRKRGEETFVGRWDAYWKSWLSVPGAWQRKPTHWMPLPDAPTTQETGE